MLTMQADEFLEAVRKNETVRVNQLLKVDPSLAAIRDKSGVSAVFLALYGGNKSLAEAIASRRTDLDVFEASALGNLDQLTRLVAQNPSLVNANSPDGFTAFALAAYLGQKGSVEYLAGKGADLNAVAKNETGFTALTGAVSQNHNEIARFLVEKGAKLDHSYEGGFTPLMHAAHAGNIELVQLLLDNGANPNARNKEGKTPLSFAVEKGHTATIDMLKKHGAKT